MGKLFHIILKTACILGPGIYSVPGSCSAQSGKDSVAELNKVTVIGKKPFYERRPDRLVINVQNSISSAGNTALDVLEHSPGVLVNRQSATIALEGKEGVVLMINGKVDHMPAEAVVEWLQGMSAGSIEKIELITTPPANLDAEGHAGYINIILKNTNGVGINGAYSATLGYGKGLVDEAGLNFNYRKGKVNIYGNLSYTRVKKPLPISMHTQLSDQGNLFENQFTGDRVEANRVLNSRIGLDYQLSKKTVIGMLVSGYDSKYTHNETNENLILKNSHADTTVRQVNSELKTWQNIGINLNLQHDFRDGGKLSVNLDYIYYKNRQPYHYSASFYDPAGHYLYDLVKRSNKLTPIWFWIGALDYSRKLGKKIEWETGFKRTLADFSNDLGVERFNQGNWLVDSSLSTKHKLSENYTAFYSSFDLAITGNTHASIGLRYEYSNYHLATPEEKDLVDRHYGNLFPVLSLTHRLNESSSVNLSYNRRISRPTFNDLAPYTYFLNENTLITGNPALQPSISNTITAGTTFKKYLFSLSFTKEDHAIAAFQPRIDSVANETVFTARNLGGQQLLSALFSVPVEIGNWWNMQYNLTGIWQQVTAAGEDPLKIRRLNLHINAIESFRIRNNIAVELSGFYQSPALSGISVQKGYGSLDVGIKKKLDGRKGSFTLSAGNLLNSNEFILASEDPGKRQATYMHVRFVQRTFKLTYSRSFGNDKLKERRERATGAEEEKGRVQ